jgi:NADH-quinone oxidoreductase subunit M
MNTGVAALAATGVVLGAAYMLLLYRRVVFGAQVNKDAAAMPDLDIREFGILVMLAGLVILLGIFPDTLMQKVSPSVEKLIVQYNAPRADHD